MVVIEKRIGILGGSFNPPHLGHLKIAQKAKKILKLDKVILVPVGIPALFKKNLASLRHRLKMTKLLAQLDSDFIVSDLEIKKAKKNQKSYSLDTIKYFKKKFRRAQLFWIIGEDSFCEILENKWKGGQKILDLVKFVVFQRKKGAFSLKKILKKKPELKKFLEKVIFVKANFPISGTKIRERIKKHQSIRGLVPQAIEAYIKKHHLFEERA